MTEAYPLQWQNGRPRTLPYRRQQSRFARTSVHAEIRVVMDEIRRLGGRIPVISSNVELRKDGLPYSNRRTPDDPGVAVYFVRKGASMVFACDRWHRVQDNIRAISKTINAIRGIERWGSGDMVNAAFLGFEALPPPDSDRKRAWWEVLGVDPQCNDIRVLNDQYRVLALERHPDNGGDHDQMADLNRAIKKAREALA